MGAITRASQCRTEIAVQDYYSSFLASVSQNPNTGKTYASALKTFASYLENNKISDPRQVTRQDIQEYKQTLVSAGYSSSTINVRLAATRAFFDWLEDRGLVESNPAARVKSVKTASGYKKDAFTVEEARTILDTIPRKTLLEKRNYVILLFMFTLGLRTVEVARLDREDVRRKDGVLVLYVQGKGHTEKDDFTPLPLSLFLVLQDYEDARKDDEPELFRARKGGRLNPETVSYIAKKEFRRAGYDSPRLTAHSTRHTAITLAAKEGFTLQEVQGFARHTRPETTEIYIHGLEKEASKIPDTVASELLK